ncbi:MULTISPECIES: cold-shock protein [Clostridium]|jgi:cold-shock DNA-binding protein family|uniref:Cold-shock protein n=2 Tax=Clostridium beijerinckii TaxID=1520 RepID=A0A1B9BMI4_CLOBE|nr:MULTISPECIES: cold-shock protein [Clostridium]ABR35069.1 putative cold-shock DNA-binding domain protein [Clostridium beijerinckii NCIMB 8052]AIU02085.1 cold-shock DNA-binding domain-containing protein [Clostridium beijerinckii ATCC 35702]AQS05671.1 cold shock protein CspA [Clostridium beijerinckii]MBA2885295.1 CspA family cold shock protein [Clostridium beijerinckii]MBA2900204.1 CspA family cold shock protein [Clostridium beijerinckii]
MKTGTVKFFNSEKGFGFIEVEGEKDVFVHSSSLSGFSIQEGDKVQFDVEKGTKGPQATNIQRV